jgi:hypothetical protein
MGSYWLVKCRSNLVWEPCGLTLYLGAGFAPMAASDATLAVISNRGIVSGARRNVANPILRAPTRRRTHVDKLLIRIHDIIQQ